MPAILCVAAHPDDEAFGPAGTIARYAAQGVPVDLLTFTRGQYGTRHPPLDSPEALGLLREYELRAAALVLGIRELTVLDYIDGQLDQASLDELAGHVSRALERSSAEVIITFGPLGITRHPDHVALHRASLRAVEGSGRPVRLFYAAVEGAWVKELNIDGPEAQPTHRIDISAFLGTKLAALACHSSQEDAREFFLRLAKDGQREELFHRAQPPVEGSTPLRDLFE